MGEKYAVSVLSRRLKKMNENKFEVFLFVFDRLVTSVTNGGSCYPEVVANSEAGSSLTSELLCRDDEWGLCVEDHWWFLPTVAPQLGAN